jgi:hypothetical protein
MAFIFNFIPDIDLKIEKKGGGHKQSPAKTKRMKHRNTAASTQKNR